MMTNNSIIRLPNERPASEKPDICNQDGWCDVAVRHEDEIIANAEYSPIHDEWHATSDGQITLYTPDGWCYQHEYNATFERRISRGYVLPHGWLPIDELIVEDVLKCCRDGKRVEFIEPDGYTWSADYTARIDWNCSAIYRIVCGNNNLVGYRIIQPLERAEKYQHSSNKVIIKGK